MATSEAVPANHDAISDRSQAASTPEATVAGSPMRAAPTMNGEHKLSATPTKGTQKPLPKEPVTAMTPRIKKKVPWKGKNIMVLLPRDDQRGMPGKAPFPLSQAGIQRMFASWQELGYDIDGFDLEVEEYQPEGTHDSQTRDAWPNFDEIEQERAERFFKVTLPDLNAWKEYENELQEAKLRALGVSFGDDEPPAPSISPATDLSRQPSVQYPPLPFSPPIPTSSASSNHGLPGFPLAGQFAPGRSSATQSPALTSGASPGPFGHFPGKFNPRQSISLPASGSPFGHQSQQSWAGQPGLLHGLNRHDSPGLMNLNGMASPQSPFGIESPGSFNMHQRHQSLQFPMLPHQQSFPFMQPARASPRLQEVREDEEELPSKSPSKTPEPVQQNQNAELQAEIDDAEYHLEEQLRNQLEHEDYNPQPQTQAPVPTAEPFIPAHERQASEHFPVPEHFANEPPKPLVLHHPRPHSRGHSLSQPYFRDQIEAQAQDTHEEPKFSQFHGLNEIPETQKADEAYEIETNPSNLGTPVQDFEFPGFGGHQKTLSTASNPWNDAVSVDSSAARRSSHSSKPSLSKLNVQAPEFKFNPGQSSFTPGGAFNFNTSNFQAASFQPAGFQPAGFQPAVFQAGVNTNPVSSPPAEPVGFVTPAKINANASAFSPGRSDFSFSASGPKFNPDAPSFTPLSDAFNSPASASGSVSKHGSIFGSIDLTTSDFNPGKKSKAIPIIRPVGGSPPKAKSPRVEAEPQEDGDGRLIDESRVKRAKSSAPDGDDVPLFAEQPKDEEEFVKDEASTNDADTALPIDTSLSSINSNQIDTQATSATPSEKSPSDENLNRWRPYEFESTTEIQNFNDARPFGEDVFAHGHKKTLSATAQPFVPGTGSLQEDSKTDEEAEAETEASPVASPVPARAPSGLGSSRFSSGQSQPRVVSGLSASRFADPAPNPKGLGASRFARSPTPEEQPMLADAVENVIQSVEFEEPEPVPEGLQITHDNDEREPTFEEIDAVMDQFIDDPSMGVNKMADAPKWQQTSPTRNLSIAAVANSSPYRLDPAVEQSTRDETSLTPREYHALPGPAAKPLPSTELEDPFIDPPELTRTPENPAGDSQPASDWDGAFTEDEHEKLENRAQFFDGRVNEVVGNLLASRLEPLEKSLFSIQQGLATRARRTPSSRRDMRSVSVELQQSDADDEDEDPIPRRSISPRRDRRLDQIRIAVMDALNAQQRNQVAAPPAPQEAAPAAILEALEDMKKSFSANMQIGDDLKRVIEEAVQSRLPPIPSANDNAEEAQDPKMMEMQAKILDLEQRLYFEQTKVENEVAERRMAEDLAAELMRKLQAAETRVEVEIINRSVYDQRVNDLEDRVRQHEKLSEESVAARREADDRLTEARCRHEAATEEVTRLRETIEQKDLKLRSVEQANSKSSMRMALLEAAQSNSEQSASDMTNKCNAIESELRDVRQDNHHWRAEFERAEESARQKSSELTRALDEIQHMQKSLTTLTTQLEENDRLRETWRGKFISLQEDMSNAAREIAEDNARRIKKDQAMLARQEVLDARLQAEAKTRERLEVEMERLQNNERSGMRAVNECKRLEGIIAEMKTENHKIEQTAMRYQREFEEARESGLSEVKRTRMALQSEIDDANNQVNVIREELEEQNSKLRAELDQVKLEADTAKAQSEMLLEEVETTKIADIEQLTHKHQNEIEDLQTQYERQVSNAKEDAHSTEQRLLERLSLSASKTEHLQDRILHLEDKLEIAKQAAAAAAAAAAAKSAGVDVGSAAIIAHPKPAASRSLELPEKISPQALRESIMVLQEQLQAREQRIEELEQIADPDAATKISKRDDEISWLRELLAVRHENLHDIIAALNSERFDRNAIKDAAIRLKANLQMEEQERERAMNGGSAITLPNIAQTIQAATPRVAQAVGPIAAAWGNWRKNLNSPASGRTVTPSRSSPNPQNNLLGGLLTPPASGLRQTPPTENGRPQPTAFASTGRRYPSNSVSARARGISNTSQRTDRSGRGTPPLKQSEAEPMTPPMMPSSVYDSDAQLGDFDDHDFFEED